MRRDDILHWRIRQRFGSHPKVSWLDVGAGNGSVSLEIAKTLHRSDTFSDQVDISPKKGVAKFDGTGTQLLELYKNKAPYDFVLFNFVLHHAADNTDGLLRAAALLGNHIIIQEDMNEEWDEITSTPVPSKSTVSSLLKKHDKNAVYHSFIEWKQKLLQLFPNYKSIKLERHSVEPATDTYGYHVPRAFFLVSL